MWSVLTIMSRIVLLSSLSILHAPQKSFKLEIKPKHNNNAYNNNNNNENFVYFVSTISIHSITESIIQTYKVKQNTISNLNTLL